VILQTSATAAAAAAFYFICIYIYTWYEVRAGTCVSNDNTKSLPMLYSPAGNAIAKLYLTLGSRRVRYQRASARLENGNHDPKLV